MKKILPLLLFTCANAQAQTHSPELTQLLSEIHEQYNSPTLMSIDKKDMADITKLPYFLQHIDEKDTAKSTHLKSYLNGLQSAYFGNVNRQTDMGGQVWFCMNDPVLLDPKRNPDFIEQLIWTVLEKTAKNDPKNFRQYNYAPAFAVPITSIIEYGLQTEYPCYNPIPENLRLPGWKY